MNVMASLFYAIAGFFVLFFAPYEGAPHGYHPPLVFIPWLTLPLILPLFGLILSHRTKGKGRNALNRFLLIRRWLMVLNLLILGLNAHFYGLLFFLRQTLPPVLSDASAIGVFVSQTFLLLLSLSKAEARLRGMRAASAASLAYFHTRQHAVAAIPFLLIDALITAIQRIPQIEEEVIVFPSLLFLPLAGVVLIMFLFFPFGMRLLLPSIRLKEGDTRERFLALARRARVHIQQMFVWQTGNWRLANASISGVLARMRFVFITDTILGFPDEELDAVFAHELGHARMRHMTLYMFLALSFVGLNLFLERALTPYPTTVQVAVLIGTVVVYWFILFGWISRRLEQSADLFATELVGTEPFIHALLRIFAYAGGTTRSFMHWRHFPIKRRIETLQSLQNDPSAIDKLHRSTRLATIILAVVVVAGIGGYLIVALEDASTPEDVVFYKRALYAGYRRDYEHALVMAERALEKNPESDRYKELVEELRRILKEK